MVWYGVDLDIKDNRIQLTEEINNNDNISNTKEKVFWQSFFAELFKSLGSTLISIGIISVLWELISKRSWLKETRKYYYATITKPKSIQFLTENLRFKMIKNLLYSFSGEQLGNMLSKKIKQKVFSEKLTRYNFIYNITLQNDTTNNDFYKATFFIDFWINNISFPFNIRVLINNDAMKIHENYKSLSKKYKDDIYRYILFTKATSFPDPIIKISKCVIKNNLGDINPQIGGIDTDNDTKYIQLSLSKKDKATYKKIKTQKVRIQITIETWIDKEWSYFPIMFGYPVCNFETRLDFIDNKHEINIIELFTASKEFQRSDNTISNDNFASTGGKLNGTILPDSGLIYIWRDN